MADHTPGTTPDPTGRREAQPVTGSTTSQETRAGEAYVAPDHGAPGTSPANTAAPVAAGYGDTTANTAARHGDLRHDGHAHDGARHDGPGHDAGVHDGRRHDTATVAAPVAAATAVDRDGDGRDDRTGAVMPTTAKEMAAAQRARYGGLHMGSAFFGWMSAVGIAVILLAILSAAGLAFGLYSTLGTPQEAADQANSGIGLGAAIALLVVLFVAYLAGGYVAGRMARFNGTKQGLGVWLWGVIVLVLAALAGLVLGTQYNFFDQLNLPSLPVDSGTATTGGLIALGAVLLVTLLGAMLGGKLGSHYHRKVDRAAFEPVEV